MELGIMSIILICLGSASLGYLTAAFFIGSRGGSECQDLINEIADLRQTNEELGKQNDRNIKRVLEATREARFYRNLIKQQTQKQGAEK